MRLRVFGAVVLAGLTIGPAASAQEWDGWYGGFSAGALTGGYHDEFDWTFRYQGVDLGGFAGYRGQLNHLVWTVEGTGEIDFADEPKGNFDWNTNTAMVGRVSTRATIGLPADHFLLYAGAGVAIGFQRADPNSPGFRSDTQPHLGIEVIGGLDTAITDKVFVRTEVRYTAFSDATYNLGHGDFQAGILGTVDAKIGLGLRF